MIMINPTLLNIAIVRGRQKEEEPAQFAFLPLSHKLVHIYLWGGAPIDVVVLVLKSILFVQTLNKWKYANILFKSL